MFLFLQRGVCHRKTRIRAFDTLGVEGVCFRSSGDRNGSSFS